MGGLDLIRWGILGAGNIAYRFAKALQNEPSSMLYAISCRNTEKAEAFAAQYPCEKLYLKYDDLLADPKVDAIYISLPHIMHCDWAVKSLNAGKPVLCEKPATINLKEMQEICDAAKRNKVLFMEAMKQRFVPLYRELHRRVESGEIGQVLSIQTSLCNEMPPLKNTYHVQPKQGGALLDVGIYCASWIEDFLSGSVCLESVAATQKNDLDYYIDAKLKVGGKNAGLECAFDRKKERRVIIFGEKGSISVDELHRPTHMLINREGYEPENLDIPYEFDDFYSEIHHFVECLKKGINESSIMPLASSVRCAEILEVIRSGLHFTPKCLEVLSEQEKILQYSSFGAEEALKLGNIVADFAKEYDREIGVLITRESDELVLFQYMMESKAPRNVDFMEGKRRAALLTGHSSLWMVVDHTLNGNWNKEMQNVPYYCPSGGAFPIRVNNQWVATLSISGLHEGKDHELVVRALCKALNKTVPVFPSAAV